MLLTQKAKRIIKYVLAGLEIVLFVIVIGLGCKISSQKVTIRDYQAKNKALIEQVDSIQRYCNALGAENVLTVNVNFNLTQKNILSFSQSNCQNIAKEVSTMTRKELYDSLYTKKSAR